MSPGSTCATIVSVATRDAVGTGSGRAAGPALRRAFAALAHIALTTALAFCGKAAFAQATGVGFSQVPQQDGTTTTLFYPTRSAESDVRRGPFRMQLAADAEPAAGNGRLIVISHGSGGSPWVHTDLSRELVRRGFVVAIPQHQGDNYLDASRPGPDSWIRRPLEVGHAIDLLSTHPGLGAMLQLDAVGVFGGSAGGHTALTLAGGTWSSSRFRDHCLQHIEADFSSCVGFMTLLRGNGLDGLKVWSAKQVIRWRFSDDTPRRHTDARVRAAVAMVPFAADFDPESLKSPVVPLGLIIADKDINQIPAFHAEAVQRACEPRCQIVMRLNEGGHGAMLSPLPPFAPGSVADHLLSDPADFDRTRQLPALHAAVADFFIRHLLAKR